MCKARRKHLTPFAVTTSGLLAPEAKALLKCFARALADKWEQPLSVTSNYVYTKVSFAVVRATHDNIFSARTRSGHGKCPVFGTDPTTPPASHSWQLRAPALNALELVYFDGYMFFLLHRHSLH